MRGYHRAMSPPLIPRRPSDGMLILLGYTLLVSCVAIATYIGFEYAWPTS